jgi:hypothetical protein
MVRSRELEYKLSVWQLNGLNANWQQKIFSFAQIFFFALTFMSSWETVALYDSASSPLSER